MSALVLTERMHGIVTLTLNDPERRNLLSEALCEALIEAVANVNADTDAHAIVIRARGKAFCAGAHLDDLRRASGGDTRAVDRVYQAFLDVANSPLPTVAIVEGFAVGAGINLALACDLRIASPSARFDTRFLNIGLHPGGGHTWMLLRALGWQHACDLLLLPRAIDAEQAQRIGLVKSITPADEIEATIHALADGFASTPRELLLRTKASLRHAVNATHPASFAHETREQMWSMQQPAFLSLLQRATTP